MYIYIYVCICLINIYKCYICIYLISVCCFITDQKSMHLAEHLNASINPVSCQGGKKNKTGLG